MKNLMQSTDYNKSGAKSSALDDYESPQQLTNRFDFLLESEVVNTKDVSTRDSRRSKTLKKVSTNVLSMQSPAAI